MRSTILTGLLAGAGLLAVPGGADAMNCYTVIDKNDNVVYRGNLPPIDLSDRGNAEREAMRKQGQHLIAMDVDRCLGIEYFTGTAGSTTLTVDQIVGGIQMRGRSPGGNTAAQASGSMPSIPARAPVVPSTPQAPPKP
jgi:hypothetical protein